MQFIYLAVFLLVSFFAAPLKAQGVSWNKLDLSVLTDDALLFDIAVPSLSTAYVVGVENILGAPGYILKTTNTGDDWSIAYTAEENWLWGVDCAYEYRCFAVGSGGIVLRTMNGTSWSEVEDSPLSAPVIGATNLNDVKVVNPLRNVVIAAGDWGQIWRSDSNGDSWSYIASISGLSASERSDVYFNSIHCAAQPSGTRTCWIVGGSTIVKSEDDGASWSVQTNPAGLVTGFRGVFALDTSKIWISSFDVAKTTNGGTSWSIGEINDPALPRPGIACLDENNCWTVSTLGGGQIRKSVDGGITWPYFLVFDDPEDYPEDQRDIFIDTMVFSSDGSRITLLPNLHEIKFYNEGLGFIVGDNRNVLRRAAIDLIPSDGWSLACANSSQYLHIIAMVKNNGGKAMDPSMLPFSVKFESLDAGGNVIGSQTYSMSEAIPPGQARTVPIPFPVGAEVFDIFNPDLLTELTFRMTVDVEGNGIVPEVNENNNSRTQTTSCGVASSGAGGGSPPPSPYPPPRPGEKDKKKKGEEKKKKSKWKK